jgi:uncharacterized protein (UPF0262 family)
MTARLSEIVLDSPDGRAPSPEIAQEQAVAIFDLLEDNTFAPCDADSGPYRLTLGLDESRLQFDLTGADGATAARFALSLGMLRQIVKDYAAICASYHEAVRSEPPAEIERLDEIRRAIHAEGADTLRDLLRGRADTDAATARRLFTLVCALTDAG